MKLTAKLLRLITCIIAVRYGITSPFILDTGAAIFTDKVIIGAVLHRLR